MNSATSVGIIGGADGPTAIFVASRLSPALLVAGLILLLVVGGLVALWISRR